MRALIYPATDLDGLDTESYRQNAEGYLLTASSMRSRREHHILDEAQAQEPHAPGGPGTGPALRVRGWWDGQ